MSRLATIVVMCVVAINTLAQAPQRPIQAAPDSEHTKWLADAMLSIQTIKIGMTRADLLELFTTEGGISSPSRRTYVYKGCRYIKVDVKFAAVAGVELSSDKIVEISRPYLAWFVAD